MKSDLQTLTALGLIGVIAVCACLGAVPSPNAGLVGAIVTGLFALVQPRKGPGG